MSNNCNNKKITYTTENLKALKADHDVIYILKEHANWVKNGNFQNKFT